MQLTVNRCGIWRKKFFTPCRRLLRSIRNRSSFIPGVKESSSSLCLHEKSSSSARQECALAIAIYAYILSSENYIQEHFQE